MTIVFMIFSKIDGLRHGWINQPNIYRFNHFLCFVEKYSCEKDKKFRRTKELNGESSKADSDAKCADLCFDAKLNGGWDFDTTSIVGSETEEKDGKFTTCRCAVTTKTTAPKRAGLTYNACTFKTEWYQMLFLKIICHEEHDFSLHWYH